MIKQYRVLGDSFTAGYNAEIGKSYVETIEANLPDSIVWNTAIGGTGTNHALASFESLAPLLKLCRCLVEAPRQRDKSLYLAFT